MTADADQVDPAATVKVRDAARRLSLSALTPIRETGPGIYFLCDADHRVMYVGQSVNAHARLAEHRVWKKDRFMRAFFLPCAAEDMNRLEGHFIRTLRPPLNAMRADVEMHAPKRGAPSEAATWGAMCEAMAKLK